MTKVCPNCGKKVIYSARFCMFCGLNLEVSEQNLCEGVNPSRNKIFTKVIKIDIRRDTPGETQEHRDNKHTILRNRALESIKVEQEKGLKPGELPGMATDGKYLLYPDSVSGAFVLYNIQEQKSCGRLNIGGSIRNATTPLYDGMFFNVINQGFLYRIGVDRKGGALKVPRYDLQLGNHPPIMSPLIYRRRQKRIILFTIANTLHAIDISGYKYPNHVAHSGKLNVLPDNDIYLPMVMPLQSDNDFIFLASRNGKVCLLQGNRLLDDTFLPRMLHDFNVTEMTYPIILDKVFYALGKSDSGKVMLCSINFQDGQFQPKSREIPVRWSSEIPENDFPLHDGLRLIIKDPIHKERIYYANYAQVIEPPPMSVELDYRQFFLIKETIYSLSLAEKQVNRFNGQENIKSPSLPLLGRVRQNIRPLSQMLFVNGIIAIMDPKQIHLYEI